MNDTTRTFRASYQITLESAVLSAHTHIITITGRTLKTIQATVDGVIVTVEEAERITRLALSLGSFEKIGETSPEPSPIGKARAHAMHVELARHGYPTNHYDLASGVLGREVASLAALTEAEARAVWISLIYGAGVAA